MTNSKADATRLAKLREVMAKNNLDACALIPGANFRYITGSVHGLMERPLVLLVSQSGQAVIVIPNLELEHFQSHGFAAEAFAWQDADGYDDAFAAALAQLNLSGARVGVEGQRLRFFEAEALRRHQPYMSLIDAHAALGSIRLHKTADELAALRSAIQISEAALQRTIEEIKIGMTEQQIVNRLEAHMNALGGEGLAFNTLVLAGDNSARPHGTPRADYAIQVGDTLLFDFGTTQNGYNADITRTFFIGQASEEQRAIYEAVRRANELGRDLVKPDITADYLDRSVLQSLKDSGFEHLIVHKTGHGLGLEVHEYPYIMRGNEQVLEAGMVFTVEPGLYQAGFMGVRIEDNVVVTEEGCESLTSFPRDLTIIG